MAYFSSNSSELSGFGCGQGCACKSCASNLAEVYEEEEPAPPGPPPKARPAPPPKAGPAPPKIGAWFGQPPLPQPRASLMPGQLRMPAFETLTGYPPGGWRLNQAQLAQIQRLAAHVIRTWTTTTPVTGIRLIGFAEAGEPQAALQRTDAARAAINAAVSQLNPRILRGIQFSSEDGGSAPGAGGIVRRVEILLWVGLGVPFAPPVQPTPWRVPRIPVGPPVQVPTPAEAARRAFQPETPEERINRILRTLPPPPPPRGSFSQMFWQRVDEGLNSTMSRVGVPSSLRGPIRAAAHAAIRQGGEVILNRALEETGLSSEAKEAIRAAVRAAAQTPR